MRRVLILGALGALLAGCSVYDRDAMPEATGSLHLAVDRCDANQAATDTVANEVECVLAAEHQFAVAIKLRKMELYDNYSARMRLLAQQADAGQISKDDVGKRFQAIRGDYRAAMAQAQDNADRRNMAIAAGLAAAGENMQRQADRDALQSAANRPLNCTSTPFGNSVTTRCN